MSDDQKSRVAPPACASANRLGDGIVVWRAPGGTWSEEFADAEIAPDAAAVATLEAAMMADVRAARVTDARMVELVPGPKGRLRPAELKERIRADGPTIHPQWGRQAVRGPV